MEESRPVRGDSLDEEPGEGHCCPLSRYWRGGLVLGAAATGAGAVASLMAGAQTAGASDGDAVLIGDRANPHRFARTKTSGQFKHCQTGIFGLGRYFHGETTQRQSAVCKPHSVLA